MLFFKKKQKKDAPKASMRRADDFTLEAGDDEGDDILTKAPRFREGIENYMVNTYKGSSVRIGKIHAVGKRENQQDSFAYSDVADRKTVEEKGIFLLVADGMGGMENGAGVSSTVAIEALRYFDTHAPDGDVPAYLNDMVQHINDKVNDFLGPGGIGRSGSTLVAMHIKDHVAHWISIGDSCIYLYQKNVLRRLNTLHNYGTQLEEKLSRGEMTVEEFMAEPNKHALTSYIGAGEVDFIDQNFEPLLLQSGDRIVLMSDGIETVSEAELGRMLHYDVEEAALKLRYLIEQINRKNQDNFTAIIVEDYY